MEVLHHKGFNTLELKSVKLRSLLRNLLLEREQRYFKWLAYPYYTCSAWPASACVTRQTMDSSVATITTGVGAQDSRVQLRQIGLQLGWEGSRAVPTLWPQPWTTAAPALLVRSGRLQCVVRTDRPTAWCAGLSPMPAVCWGDKVESSRVSSSNWIYLTRGPAG